MKVRDVMITDPTLVPHHFTYAEVAKILHDKDLVGVPVVDEKGKLVGMVTERDLLRVLFPYAQSYHELPNKYVDFEEREAKMTEIKDDKITKFLNAKIVTTKPDMPIMQIGAIMLSRGLHTVPVLDHTGIVIGVLNRRDIYRGMTSRYLGI